MISLLLFLVAVGLFYTLTPLALIHWIIDAIRYDKPWERAQKSFRDGAEAIDVLANVLFAPMMNAYFIIRGGYHFGQPEEKLSSALGKNWLRGTLSHVGEGCVGCLNLLDKDHCWKAIKGGPPEGAEKPADIPCHKTALFLLAFIALFSASTYLLTLL